MKVMGFLVCCCVRHLGIRKPRSRLHRHRVCSPLTHNVSTTNINAATSHSTPHSTAMPTVLQATPKGSH
jgi:hypothetical protein